jgi:hypothetical protein
MKVQVRKTSRSPELIGRLVSRVRGVQEKDLFAPDRRVRPRGACHSNGVTRAAEGCEFRFELMDLRAHAPPSGRDNILNRLEHVIVVDDEIRQPHAPYLLFSRRVPTRHPSELASASAAASTARDRRVTQPKETSPDTVIKHRAEKVSSPLDEQARS